MANKSINIDLIKIYALTNIDGSVKYIGVTRRNINYRFNNHIYESKHYPKRNKRTKWINKENFKIKIILLDEVLESEWQFWEKYWISQFKTWGYNLVNSNNGGGGTLKRDDNFSKWLSGRNKNNKYRLGKKHTDKSKKKMSKSHLGQKNVNKGKKLPKDWINNLKGKRTPIKKYFIECPKCGKEIGYSTIYIKDKAIKNKQTCRSCFQKNRVISDEVKDKMSLIMQGKNSIKISQLDKNGNLIKNWNSMSEAERELKIYGIGRVCNGKRKTCGGFKWKYLNE